MTRQDSLAEVLRFLKAADYQFVAVTPATHARVLSRPPPRSNDLRDIFGWNRPFDEGELSPDLLALLRAADALETDGGKLRSRVRVASLGAELLLHSAFPTDSADAVFFGPDTYRFTRFVAQHLPAFADARRLVDMGAGAGAGAIAAAKLQAFETVTLVDTNAAALELARVNAAVASVEIEAVQADAVPAGVDLIIANPPYMIDAARRSYRDGGGVLGGEVALDWVGQAIAGLPSGGAMLLYTGAAYVNGQAPLVAQLESACAKAGFGLQLAEIDPDVFGEELEQPQYADVERIAAIGAVITAPGTSSASDGSAKGRIRSSG